MNIPLLIVVDDERDMADLVGQVAEDVGFRVKIAESGKQFQSIWLEEEPEAVVMDIILPDLEGNALIRWLTEKGSRKPIVLISGYGKKYIPITEHLGMMRGANIVESLGKPIDIDDLEAVLTKLLPGDSLQTDRE